MKQRLKILSLFLLLGVFVNCQKDDLPEEEAKHFGPGHNGPARYLTGEEALRAKEKLRQATIVKKINAGVLNGNKSNGWDIDFSEVLLVTDTTGKTTYTYRITHPLMARNQFYNLVHTEDALHNVNIMRLKYTMSAGFTNRFTAGTARIDEFEGSVTFTPVLGNAQLTPVLQPVQNPQPEPEQPAPTNPCEEETIINVGGSGPGGGGGPTSQPVTQIGGSGNGSGLVSYPDLGRMSCLEWVKVMCSENTAGHYGGNAGCTATSKGATYLVNKCTNTVTRLKDGITGQLVNPCPDMGSIGVLFPEYFIGVDNCEELKEKSDNAAFAAKMAELKTKAGTQNFESAYVLYENATQGLLFSNEYTGSTSKPEVELKTTISQTQSNANSIGFIHSHLNSNKTFKVFSFSDIVALAKLAKISTRPPKELALYVVTASGTFAMKIKDITALKNMGDTYDIGSFSYEKAFNIFVKQDNSIDKQVLGFLKFLKDRGINSIDLYQQNTTVNSPDIGKWQKLELNQNNTGVNKSNC